tara:strand:- start:2127 stop:2420 length:294 start_codon:yes stop_codon:yes gene_type:complete
MGCKVTIKAAIPVGIPIDIEKKTPPRYKPWKKIPLNIDWNKFDFFIIIDFFEYKQNKKKPTPTKKNLKANAEKGSLLSTIGFVVINADDHNKTKMNG